MNVPPFVWQALIQLVVTAIAFAFAISRRDAKREAQQTEVLSTLALVRTDLANVKDLVATIEKRDAATTEKLIHFASDLGEIKATVTDFDARLRHVENQVTALTTATNNQTTTKGRSR